MKKAPILCLFILLQGSVAVLAQGWGGGGQGEIEDAQVIIEKSRDIVLPQASRNFEKVPPLPVEESTGTAQTYRFNGLNVKLPGLTVRPRVLRLKTETLNKLYKGYVRTGFGNYTTPYFDGYLYNKRDKDHLIGVHLNHRSSAQGPVDKSNSGNGTTGIGLSGNYYRGPLTLGADAGYEHTYWHFYGYPEGLAVSGDTIKQHFNRIHVHGFIRSTPEDNKSGFLLNAGYSGLTDNYRASESRISGNLTFSVPVQDNLSFALFSDAQFLERKDSSSVFRDLIKLRPSVFYRHEDLDIHGGLTAVIQNDTISNRNPVLLYPFVSLEYHIAPWISGFLDLDGDMEAVTLHSISRENPYINDNVPLYHTDKKFGLDWGIKTNLGNVAYFKAGFSYAGMKDMYYYLNDSTDLSRFNILYDRGITNLTRIYGALNLSKPGLYMLNMAGNYYHYGVDKIEAPWHRPSWRIDINSRYDIYDKIILSADLYFMGGIKAKDFSTGNILTLSSVRDINFTIDYLFSERFSLFLDFRNILGNSYEIYWRYPSRRLQFMAGASVNF